MYRVSVEGKTRSALFEIDTESRTFNRLAFEIKDSEVRGDIFSVNIKDTASPSNIDVNWIVFDGTFEQMFALKNTTMPIIALNAERIIKEFDRAEEEGRSTIFITYPTENEPSRIIAKSKIYKTLKVFHPEIIANMYNKERSSLTVLEIDY